MSLFRAALERRNDGRPPVWFMRQAGRYHGHYRKLRERFSFMDLCKRPEVAAEATLGPIDDFGFDAAILFSDLLFPLEVLGMPLSYEPAPKLGWHLRTRDDLSRLNGHAGPGGNGKDPLAFQADALRLIRSRLSSEKGLLGFVGGPLTLFFYAAEGTHQGDLANARAGLTDGRYGGFCERLISMLAANMAQQWQAGSDCVAILDTVAGELSPEDFATHAVPALTELLRQFKGLCPQARVLYYSRSTDARHWRHLRTLPIDALGVDWRTPIADVLTEFGDQWAIQGNLDPQALLLPESDFLRSTDRFFAPVRALPAHLRRGWICGLGHGVLPPTPEAHVRLFIDLQREMFE